MYGQTKIKYIIVSEWPLYWQCQNTYEHWWRL